MVEDTPLISQPSIIAFLAFASDTDSFHFLRAHSSSNTASRYSSVYWVVSNK